MLSVELLKAMKSMAVFKRKVRPAAITEVVCRSGDIVQAGSIE